MHFRSSVTLCLFFALFLACQQQKTTPPPPPSTEGNAILKHKYWVSKPFNDALFASKVIDTLYTLPCGELIFNKDTVIMTACLSDAGVGVYKITSPTSLELTIEGLEGPPSTLQLDEKTGILHLNMPGGAEGWPQEYVAQDDVDATNLDNITINLGRKRLAGTYRILTPKGTAAIAAFVELHADGTHLGFGDFDTYEPWPTGIAGEAIVNPPTNLMYFVKKGQEANPEAIGWQVNGDTLRLWETKATNQEGDMPEYKVTKLRNIYLKTKITE